VLGGAILALAIPRSIGAWEVRFDAAPVLDNLIAGKPVSDEALARAVAALRAAIGWGSTAPWLRDLGLLETNQAQRLYVGDPARGPVLEAADRHLTGGLRVDPVDGLAWIRLASVRELRGLPRRDVVAALVKALDVAPYDRGLWMYRSSQLVNYRAELTADERAAFASNVRTLWAADPDLTRQLIGYAASVDALDFISDTLGNDPEARAAIDQTRATIDKVQTSIEKLRNPPRTK
jgi:hypothetical protein